MKVVVEGLWATGKTTLCEHLERERNFIFIREPDHRTLNRSNITKSSLDEWYRAEHLKRVEEMTKITGDIVVERSFASTLAYIEARDRNVNLLMNKVQGRIILKKHQQIDLCIILGISLHDYAVRICSLENKRLKSFIESNWEFIERYSSSLEYYCDYLFGQKRVKEIQIFKKDKLLNERIVSTHAEQIIFGGE